MRIPVEDVVTETTSGLGIGLIGGSTAVLELDGLRLLTEPTFDPPGPCPRPSGLVLGKLAGPSVGARQLGAAGFVGTEIRGFTRQEQSQ